MPHASDILVYGRTGPHEKVLEKVSMPLIVGISAREKARGVRNMKQRYEYGREAELFTTDEDGPRNVWAGKPFRVI